MFVRWQRRAPAWWRQEPHTRKHPPAPHTRKSPPAHWAAILVESVRVEGKPKQRHIAYLAEIKEDRLGELTGRCRFYVDVSPRWTVSAIRFRPRNASGSKRR